MERNEIFTQQLLEKLNADEDFCKALFTAEDAPAAQKVLNENGFEITLEEVEAFFKAGVNEMNRYMDSLDDELDEDQLDDVSGGGFVKGILRTGASCVLGFGYGCACGVCPALSAGAPYVATGLAVWSAAGFKSKKKKKK